MIGDDDLRDLFAMFAMNGLLSDIKGIYEPPQMKKLTNLSYEVADAMMEARKVTDEAGIAGIGKRKYVRKNAD
jgi:hypothetical protein